MGAEATTQESRNGWGAVAVLLGCRWVIRASRPAYFASAAWT
jgi:hypothetical protein